MNLYKLLESQANSNPESIAVESSAGSLTYGELAHKSTSLANYFTNKGVKRGDAVFIELPKNEEAIIALWASLKIGACYVPINTQLKESTIGAIIKNCEPKALVSDCSSKSLTLKACNKQHLELKAMILNEKGSLSENHAAISWDDLPDNENFASPAEEYFETDLAYILHTSGSTGVPKGVQISNGAALAFIYWAKETFSVDEFCRLACTSPLHFDLSVFDIFVAVCVGATNILIPNQYLLFPQSAKLYIEEKRVSHLYTVPFFLTQLVNNSDFKEGDFATLKHLMFAGEVLPQRTLCSLQSLLPETKLHNLYGPTETNVCSFYTVKQGHSYHNDLLIGKSASSSQLYIVDESFKEVSSGIQGQIAVSGPSLMSGYVGCPQSSNDKFVQIQCLDGEKVQLAYLTGDFGVLERCGNIRFKGRQDEQIKRRGYRVELGEIGSLISRVSQVHDFAVLSYKDEQDNTAIVCILVKSNEDISSAKLQNSIAQEIPHYMQPDKYVFMKEIPRTSTGKLARSELVNHITNL
ncbi:amino acid adenylation domain-containing protein [Alteromonas portus]|uniref:amino acid adenylation domain-containing protein n=1 Tax=Alteromonas portus TaxID=2565549 RepID=UPI003BF7FDE2